MQTFATFTLFLRDENFVCLIRVAMSLKQCLKTGIKLGIVFRVVRQCLKLFPGRGTKILKRDPIDLYVIIEPCIFQKAAFHLHPGEVSLLRGAQEDAVSQEEVCETGFIETDASAKH